MTSFSSAEWSRPPSPCAFSEATSCAATAPSGITTRAGQVAGEEGQPDQRHTGLLDRRDERVHLAVGGHRRRERPPELNRRKPRGTGRGQPPEQWALR